MKKLSSSQTVLNASPGLHYVLLISHGHNPNNMLKNEEEKYFKNEQHLHVQMRYNGHPPCFQNDYWQHKVCNDKTSGFHE